MTNTKTTILTDGQAAQLDAGRISKDTIYNVLRCQRRYYIEIADMLTAAATADYLDSLDKDNLPAPEEAANGLLQKTADTFREFNGRLDEGSLPVPLPEELTACQVAKLMMALCHIRLVAGRNRYECNESGLQGPDRYDVMLYVADRSGIYDGESDIGTYTCNLWPIIDTLSPHQSVSFAGFAEYADEVEFWLRLFAKKASLSYFHGFMPLENGVLNCRTKELLPFSPEYVFDECTYFGSYEEGGDGPVIRFSDGREESMDDWIKSVASGSDCEELRRILAECV